MSCLVGLRINPYRFPMAILVIGDLMVTDFSAKYLRLKRNLTSHPRKPQTRGDQNQVNCSHTCYILWIKSGMASRKVGRAAIYTYQTLAMWAKMIHNPINHAGVPTTIQPLARKVLHLGNSMNVPPLYLLPNHPDASCLSTSLNIAFCSFFEETLRLYYVISIIVGAKDNKAKK